MATMTEVIVSRACSRFCGVYSSNRVPDGDTIGRFRALPVEHGLQVKLYAQVHDVTMVPKLLTGDETEVYGDSGYLGAQKREDSVTHNKQGKKIKYKVNRRPSQSKHHSARSMGQIRRREHEKSSVRAKVEHVFGVVKGLFGYRKTRYRGLRKQVAKLNMLFALANLYLADKRCLPA